MTYDEIKLFDCGSAGHPDFETQQKLRVVKPLLKDVIKAVESFIDAKGLDPVTYNILLQILEQEVEHEEDLQTLLEDFELL